MTTAKDLIDNLDNQEQLENLLKNSTKDIINPPDSDSIPLLLAALSGNVQSTELLLKYGADPNIKDKSNCITPLMAACDQGSKDRESFKHCKVAEILINSGANIDEYSKIGLTSLMFAVDDESIEIVELLLNRGANVNLENNNKYCYITNGKLSGFSCANWTALSHACLRGNLDIVKLLLKNQADLNLGFSLCLACQEGHETVVDYLLDNGVDTKKTYKNNTPLYIACSKGNFNIVKKLCQYVEIDNDSIFVSYTSKNTDLINFFLEKGADINKCNEDGWFPLLFAVDKNDGRMVEFLLTNKAHVDKVFHKKDEFNDKYFRNSFFPDGMTPLIYAVYKGYLEIVNILLEQGATINSKDVNGLTSLFYACKSGYLEIIKVLLINSSIDINYRDQNDRNFIDYTIFYTNDNNTDIIKMFIDKNLIKEEDVKNIYEQLDLLAFFKNPTENKHEQFYKKCQQISYTNSGMYGQNKIYELSKKTKIYRTDDYNFSTITNFIRNFEGYYKFSIDLNDRHASGMGGDFSMNLEFTILDNKIVHVLLSEGICDYGGITSKYIYLSNKEQIIDTITSTYYMVNYDDNIDDDPMDEYSFTYTIIIYDNQQDLSKYFGIELIEAERENN